MWTYDKKAKAWYFHRFYDFQPDLNTKNPEVQQEMLRIMGFWIELGVAGFRLDAVPFVIALEEKGSAKPHECYPLLRTMREACQFRDGDSVLLAEANVPPKESIHYFGKSAERLHMMFNFHVNPTIFYALATADTRPLKEALEDTRDIPEAAQWCQFLRNHDELDLSTLTEKQRQAVFAAFAPEKDMRVFDRGIRRRLSPMLNGDRRQLELANSLLLSLPGTPMLRYGEEIGMGENLRLEGREAIRTPMQWSDTEGAGFTTADKTFVPLIEQGPYNHREVNVLHQRHSPESPLNWTERMIRLRKESPEIGCGSFRIIETPDDILALRYDWRGSSIVTLHNFSDEPRAVEVPITDDDDTRPLLNLLRNDKVVDDDGTYSFVLEPYGYRWFRIGEISESLARQPHL